MKRLYVICLAIICISIQSFAAFSVTNMRVCDINSPIGMDRTPIFSWQVTSTERGFYQVAYQIDVTDENGTEVWKSGKVESDLQSNIIYEGTPLQSRTRYNWTLTIYDGSGSASTPSSSGFETAFMKESEWTAKWINAEDTELLPSSSCEIDFRSPVSCRYLKIDVTKLGLPASTDASYYYFQLSELEAYSGSTNVALGTVVTPSSNWNYSTIWNSTYLTDGKITNNALLGFTSQPFSGNSQHIYLTIDLGSIKTIDKVVLYPRQDVPSATSSSSAANFPASFTVQSSSDNVTYTTQYQATNLPAPIFQVNAKRLPLFGYNFVVPNGKTIRRGRIYATALGIFTMHLNGQAVTENKLEPGETEFQKSILYSTYDVTDKLTNGDNTLIANVGGGLFNITALSGRYTKPEIFNSGPKCLKSELFIDYSDGSSDHFVTDTSWKYTQSAVTGTNWWGGEDYDARREIAGLYDHYFDVSSWNTVKEVSPTFYTNTPNTTQNYTKVGTLKARFYEPLRVVETWQGVNVTLLSNGNYRLDFGRNYAGQYKFTLNGTSGQTITLRAGERLNSDGSCYRDSQYANIYDTYTFKGDNNGETWGPEFMYHGSRYLEISGLTKAPNASNFTAYRIRSNMENIGSMKTSNTLLNQIHTICRDAIQSNLYNTITDCPQREKLGWLEVPNMMYNSIVANYDMKTFYQKVVMDCFDTQYADGHVPSTSPHWMVVYDDDPNWGGTSILVPYKNYKLYGDKALMKTYYTKMKTLIDYYATKSSGYIMLGSSYSVLSDWGQNTAGLTNQVPGEFTITTTYYYMLNAMAEMATQLGNSADAQKYTALASNVKTAFNAKFYGQYNPGVYEYGNMAEYGMPLYYGLVDSANVASVASKMAGAVKSSNYKIKTGEIGLKPVLMSLAKYGYNDIVYKMANQTDYPSYGYFVMQGCTTTPEFWDMSQSQNHCMMDHIEEWFYSELGGIKNLGIGYKTIKIQPWIPTDMTQMDISTKCLYGKIRSSYQKAPKGGYVYTFEVPESSTATIVVPVINNMKLMEGIDEVSVGNGIQSVTYSDSLATVVVGSGSYTFSMGETGDTDTALEEVIWTPVHSTNQLTAGSVIKIQETAPCAQYNTYSKTWNSGRFIGYSASNPIATGNFIRGAMKDFAANLVIDSPTSYSIDGKDTYCCNLKNPGTSLYVNSRNNSFTMLSWYTSPLLWGFDIADGKASFFKYGTTLTKTGNYVFFYDNGIQSSIFSNGASTNYAPIWNVYKQYNVIDSASVILAQSISGKDSIFYQRSMDQNGRYETIVLPFTVSEQELPKDYSFYRFSGSEITDHNTVKLYIQAVTSLIAGEAYMMQYSGNNPSLVHQQFEFRKVFETAVNNANIVSGTYKYLTPTDIVPGKTLFVLQPDGKAFIHAGASDHVSPFRACIITSSASAPDRYEIVVNQSGTDLLNPFADNNGKMDVYNILGQKVLLQATRDDIDQLKNGLYVTKYGKFIIHK
jgi:alpha-L-rhamnosidase